MAKKAIKKPTPKVVKKTAAKPAAKKTVTKRVATKPTKKVVRATAPVVEKTSCACGNKCHCCCCRGHRFVRFGIKVIVLCVVFMCGMAVAPLFMRDMPKSPMHNMKFDDSGCVVLESVTCPKMLETLATADENADGCISRDEIRAAMHAHHAPRHQMDDMPEAK